MTRVFAGVDALRAAVGEHLGVSEWHTITQQAVDMFAMATGDDQWIHVDVERAASGPFGATIAHGYLTLSLLPMLCSTLYRIEDVKMGINYGLNKVRFPAPVRVGSRVRASVEVTAVRDLAQGVQLTLGCTIEVEGQERPACVAETLSVFVSS